MFLITSAAYVAPELSAEFGLLPPAFLPVGNRRLFVHQHRAIASADAPVYLSLPEDFPVDPMDRDLLDRLGIVVLPVPAGLTLGQSIAHSLDAVGYRAGPLRILHGDTLIHGLPAGGLDVFSVGETRSYYRWTEAVAGADGALTFTYGFGGDRLERRVLSGYFAFSDTEALTVAIARADGDFIHGLTLYARTQGLSPIDTADWLDFGSVHTYYQSKAAVNTARAFNSLAVTRRTVRKASRDHAKIAAEAGWYRQLPARLAFFAPRLLDEDETADGRRAYTIEHLFLPTLSDLLVFGRLPPFVWQRILAGLDEFLGECAAHGVPAGGRAAVAAAATDLYGPKTRERLDRFAAAHGLDLERPWRLNGGALPGLAAILADVVSRITPPGEGDLGIAHGDFCFSNVFYDFRTEAVRVIDPRGLAADGTATLWGDRRYDIAKLRHSVIGRYDVIMAGYYGLEERGPYDLAFTLPDNGALQALEAMFRAARLGGHSLDEVPIQAITVLLFLSMLPLHDDEPRRQKALLANALRLYASLPDGSSR